MIEERYAVKVRPARAGFTASVSKETFLKGIGTEWDDAWIGWEPEPTYWRPTESWAVRRAARKKLRLEQRSARRAAVKVVES